MNAWFFLQPLPLQDCLDHPLDLMRSAEQVKFWIDFHSQVCAVFRVNRTMEEPRDALNLRVMKIKVGFCWHFVCTYTQVGRQGLQTDSSTHGHVFHAQMNLLSTV